MGIRFITFTPVKGAYKKAIRPYKKWYESADMSPLIEVDGKYYRILRTTTFLNLAGTRKIVISDEEGKRGWKRKVKWLKQEVGEFEMSKYLDDLWNRNDVKAFTKVNINEIMEGHWVYSPDYIY